MAAAAAGAEEAQRWLEAFAEDDAIDDGEGHDVFADIAARYGIRSCSRSQRRGSAKNIFERGGFRAAGKGEESWRRGGGRKKKKRVVID